MQLEYKRVSAMNRNVETHINIEFSSIIASTVHDMKNSLNIVLNSLDEFIQENNSESSPRLCQLQSEAKRLNNKLIQLLSFYKLSNTSLTANVNEYCVYDLLLESLLQDESTLELRGIGTDIGCDEYLLWVFDRELVSGVLSNAINNAVRYARSKLFLEANIVNKELVISIHDDGAGFPVDLLENGIREDNGVSFSNGNTGLGLYFSQVIAQLHRNNNRTGQIKLSNGGKLDGACFSIILP